MFKFLIVAITSLFFLSACAGAVPWNKQNYAGINYVHFKWCEALAADGTTVFQPCEVTIIDGKEQGAIDFKFKMLDGTVLNFAAEDVAAFTGQEIRAEVERAVAEITGSVFEKGLDVAGDLLSPVPDVTIPDDEPDA